MTVSGVWELWLCVQAGDCGSLALLGDQSTGVGFVDPGSVWRFAVHSPFQRSLGVRVWKETSKDVGTVGLTLLFIVASKKLGFGVLGICCNLSSDGSMTLRGNYTRVVVGAGLI